MKLYNRQLELIENEDREKRVQMIAERNSELLTNVKYSVNF